MGVRERPCPRPHGARGGSRAGAPSARAARPRSAPADRHRGQHRPAGLRRDLHEHPRPRVQQRHARERDEVGERRGAARRPGLLGRRPARRPRARPPPGRARPHARVAQPAAGVADLGHLHRRRARGDPAPAHHRRGLALPRARLRVGRRQRGVQRGRHAARHHLAAPARPRLHRQGVPVGPPGRPARQALLQRLQPRVDRPQERRGVRARRRTCAARACASTASASRATSGSSTPIPTRSATTSSASRRSGSTWRSPRPTCA